MKKRAITLLLVVFLILSMSLIYAQDDDKVEKGYDCLEEKVKDNCDSLSIEEQAFTVLAIGDCKSELEDSSKNGECWPSSGCRLKDTALSILALRKSNKNTDDAEDWILNQAQSPNDLIWFLEIDSDEETSCQISYNEREYDVIVKEDKKLSSSAGSCLSIDQGGYWLRIDNDCYDTNLTISCDREFLTTLLYKKKTGSTIYVSSKTNFGASEGTTEEKVNALCFGSGCDYEGSLWATLALSETGHDISPYLPYLIAMAEENEKFFPSSFLYILTEYDDFFSQIIDLQTNDYWRITDSSYSQFYDTSLGLLALQDLDAQQVDSTKSYLLEVQDEDGCWRTVRDTAFILYAAWPRSTGGSGGGGEDYCKDYDYYCVSALDCDTADQIDFPCESSLGKVCCKEEPIEETCSDKGGEICEGDEECSSKLIVSSDPGDCCSGNCEIPPEPVVPECEQENHFCRSLCDDDEEVKSYDCDSGDICCGQAPIKKSYWWIWLLVILIILVVLGIVFKDRLRAFFFKMKNKMGRGKGPARPGPGSRRFPPGPPPSNQGMRPRMILPRRPVGPGSSARPAPARPMPRPRLSPTRKPASKTDKELDETLKKLKEMSK